MKLSLASIVALVAVSLFFRAFDAFAAGEAIQVQGGPWMLAGRAFKSVKLSPHPHLIVVIHGDAPFGNPTYQYTLAQSTAEAMNDVVAVGLLRPGYNDAIGGASEGDRGFALGDNYTAQDIASVAAAAKDLMSHYQAADLTLVGHSGGSTISADILALYPHLARDTLLVSCPCDVPAFRWSMMKYQWNPLWLIPVNAVSPQDHVAEIPKDTIVHMVVGSNDPITPPMLTLRFAAALKARGGDVQVVELPKLGHEILLEPAVLDQLRILMNAEAGRSPSN
jgi:pimeloyl-ACP methyl ester carboxylesterase